MLQIIQQKKLMFYAKADKSKIVLLNITRYDQLSNNCIFYTALEYDE